MNIEEMQVNLNAYGFENFKIYERTGEWAAIDVQDKNKSETISCIERLRSFGLQVEQWEHYIEIYIGKEN